MPELEKLITDDPSVLDYERIIRDIFYQVSYADYLMSLPMGAGKTFLMAAIIYLDCILPRMNRIIRSSRIIFWCWSPPG